MGDYLIALDKLWDEEISVIEDQFYTIKAITDPQYRLALEHILQAKQEHVETKRKEAPMYQKAPRKRRKR